MCLVVKEIFVFFGGNDNKNQLLCIEVGDVIGRDVQEGREESRLVGRGRDQRLEIRGIGRLFESRELLSWLQINEVQEEGLEWWGGSWLFLGLVVGLFVDCFVDWGVGFFF